MSNKNRSSGSAGGDSADSFIQGLSDRARTAAASITDATANAAAAIDASRPTAADGLDAAASALRDRIDDLPGSDTVRHVARATAERLSTGADYVRSHDAKRVMEDVTTFVKSNPGPALAIAASFGFLLGRALSRD